MNTVTIASTTPAPHRPSARQDAGQPAAAIPGLRFCLSEARGRCATLSGGPAG